MVTELLSRVHRQELRVRHQELQIQNQELKKAFEELEVLKESYEKLYDFAPVGYLTLDENNRIIQANFTAADLLGLERQHLVGRRFSRLVSPDWTGHFYRHRRECLETGERQSCELALIGNHDDPIHVQLEMRPPREPHMDESPPIEQSKYPTCRFLFL